MSKIIVKEILGSKMCLFADDPGISARLIENGTTEWDCPKIVQEIVKPGWTCIDVGANLGVYALLEARLVGSKGSVHAIEPVPDNTEILDYSIWANDYNNIKVHELAVSDHNGEIDMIISIASNGGTCFDKSKASKRYLETIEKEFKECKKVKLMKLDDWLVKENLVPEDINLLWMDIEGYEVEALAGATNLLLGMPIGSFVFIEFHPVLFERPANDLCPTVANLLSIGFEPMAVVLGAETRRNVSGDNLLDMISGEFKEGWVLAFLEKVRRVDNEKLDYAGC